MPLITSTGRAAAVKLAIIVVALTALGIAIAANRDLRSAIHEGLQLVRTAGPAVFFLCMIVLPAIGAPLSLFTLTAASLFGTALGMPQVILLAMAAITANIALSYFLASQALHPLFQRIVTQLGYRMPQVAVSDATDLIVLLRVTPGVPFPVQNYLLGLARVPFTRYLAISCLIAFPLNTAFIVLGEALLAGRGRAALLAVLLLLALLAAVNLIRRRYVSRTPPPP